MAKKRKGKAATFDPATEGKLCLSKNNVPYLFLNPDEKGRRFAVELSEGCNVMTGEKLSNTQKAYRSGFLKARSDSAKVFKSNQRKRKN